MRSSASASGLQERRHGRLVADSPQRLGGGAAVLSRRLISAARSVVGAASVAPEARDMDRGLPDRLVGIAEGSRGPSTSRGGIVDPGERPDGVAPQAWRGVHWSATSRSSGQIGVFCCSGRESNSITCRCTAGRGSSSNVTMSSTAREHGSSNRCQSSFPADPRPSARPGA